MFTDVRSKKVVLVSHCILNQNAISDGTADAPVALKDIIYPLIEAGISILQMPCPELNCLGLDRGDVHGGERPVVVENTRIRRALKQPDTFKVLSRLVDQVVYQVEEYLRNGFEVVAVIGMNRSPSCGVDTTSDHDQEITGRGVFIDRLREELEKKQILVPMYGVKGSEPVKLKATIDGIIKGLT
ncbi:MAG: 2-thiouracil desulfurase family protein [Candidatus Bathyarchaeota archaeon]|nr:2-thiouracil desulfurase family protein [Candidatus Bathyarchaeota archaeon]